ncbi:MAG TPA: 16S rRNA (adenine(1518)-N(6)/adenine(1519)-N(6))-dimethyltransferase RsmA [Gammaproteobacteria bacterium]|nr:16S rRNA (adenine(1518)-N(6)/adenine(1519)-N(6))-dimethyltransferase RsmA [Gammaproteobacteria bacterium]
MTHHPRKRFGQNFLIDTHIIKQIVAAIHPVPKQNILEIGPGQGALTAELVASGATIDAVEIDRDLAQHLQQEFIQYKNFHLHCADILKFELAELAVERKTHKLRVVGNLPYNISTPLLFKLFENVNNIQDMYFMLQREVAHRLTAHPNTKEYGRMSVMAQYYCTMQVILDVPPTAFSPQPKVHSCIVHFTPYIEPQIVVADHALLQDIVTHAFSQRRKTIANSLKDFISQEELIGLQLDPKLRAENLRLMDYSNITNYLAKD